MSNEGIGHCSFLQSSKSALRGPPFFMRMGPTTVKNNPFDLIRAQSLKIYKGLITKLQIELLSKFWKHCNSSLFLSNFTDFVIEKTDKIYLVLKEKGKHKNEKSCSSLNPGFLFFIKKMAFFFFLYKYPSNLTVKGRNVTANLLKFIILFIINQYIELIWFSLEKFREC